MDYVRHPSVSAANTGIVEVAALQNHTPNENMKIACFFNGIRTGAALLDRVGASRS